MNLVWSVKFMIVNQPAPIFLLLNNEPDGPHEAADVMQMRDCGEIVAETLASIEGMKSWRSVNETLAWAHAGLFAPVKADFEKVVTALAQNQIDLSSARLNAAAVLKKNSGIIMTLESDILSTLLEANANLYREYQNWELHHMDANEAFPAVELKSLRKPKFPRDWAADWQSAGGTLISNRMVARRDDPVWVTLSDFGFPFPPFSLDVMMWTRAVSYADAEKLGVVSLSDVVQPQPVTKPFQLIGVP